MFMGNYYYDSGQSKPGNMANLRIVIIGGGIAALAAAEAARDTSGEADITLIHREPSLPYNRMNLTRYIAGEIAVGELNLRDADWYAKRKIETVHGTAVSLDRESHVVTLENTTQLRYDRLITATGSAPFIPPIPGAEKEGVTALRTLADADAILQRANPGIRAVCIGGGLLGIELAAGLNRHGAKITVLEGYGWLLPRQLAPQASAVLKLKIEILGVSVRCGVKVAGILGNSEVTGIKFESGETLDADAVLISAGVRPNVAVPKGAGLDVGKGLSVDDRMATSDPDIFGAGDVTEHRGVVYGLWQPAMEQGKVAGINAAGGSATFKGMAPSAFLKVVGIDVFSIGDFMPEGDNVNLIEKAEGGTYSLLAIRDGILVGANLVGDVSAAITVKNAVTNAGPVLGNPRLLELFPELASGLGGTE